MPIVITPNPDTFDDNVDIAVGLGFPLSITGNASGSGQFSQTFSINDQVIHNLRQVLLTIKGEIPNNPSFGSDLYRMVFDPATDNLSSAIKTEIKSVCETWMPYITISEIDTVANEDLNTMNVTIHFVVDQTGFEQAMQIAYNGTTGTATATATSGV